MFLSLLRPAVGDAFAELRQSEVVVYPAAGLIRYFRGDTTVLINKGETGMGSRADLVITDPIGQVLSRIRV